jgi:hypothetical protein
MASGIDRIRYNAQAGALYIYAGAPGIAAKTRNFSDTFRRCMSWQRLSRDLDFLVVFEPSTPGQHASRYVGLLAFTAGKTLRLLGGSAVREIIGYRGNAPAVSGEHGQSSPVGNA